MTVKIVVPTLGNLLCKARYLVESRDGMVMAGLGILAHPGSELRVSWDASGRKRR